MSITLRVNHRSRTVDAPPGTPLLWVLRDLLDLKGAKYGCGIGVCGACTVHIDGHAVRSCMTHLGSVANQQILTIEGLAEDERHPVLEAWEDADVPQCGYCQPGQIMAAVAKVAQVKAEGREITDDDLDTIRNICRCGTYSRIRAAIREGAQHM